MMKDVLVGLYKNDNENFQEVMDFLTERSICPSDCGFTHECCNLHGDCVECYMSIIKEEIQISKQITEDILNIFEKYNDSDKVIKAMKQIIDL